MIRIAVVRATILAVAGGIAFAQPMQEADLQRKREAEALHRASNSQAANDAANARGALVDKRVAEALHLNAVSLLRSGRVVSGKPYSAETTTRSTQSLADGNVIIRENLSRVYRDGFGRTRREQKLQMINLASPSLQGAIVVISDPVAKVDLILDPERKTARRFPRLETEPGETTPASEAGTKDLGTRVIEGLTCRGTLRTTIIAAGDIGNVRPLVIRAETWYSSAIEAIVLAKTSDPRFGETVYALRNVSASEPDATLFQMPFGYAVEFEGKSGVMMRPK